MAYTPTNWQDGVTPVNAVNMNKLEQGLAAAVGIPADVVVTPGTAHLIRSRLTAGDANPTFRLTAEGRLEWGAGGASTPDVSLIRSPGGGGGLETDSWFWAKGFIGSESPFYREALASTEIAFEFYLNPWPGADNFKMLVNGQMQWGPGTSPLDVTLRRYGITTLGIDGSLVVSPPVGDAAGGRIILDVAGGWAYPVLEGGGTGIAFASVSVDNIANWEIYTQELVEGLSIFRKPGGAGPSHDLFRFTQGGLRFSGGGATGNLAVFDTRIWRNAAGELRTDVMIANSFRTHPTGGQVGWHSNPVSGANYMLYHSVQGEANPRLTIDGFGSITWGTGAAAGDTMLQRSGVASLYLNGSLAAAEGVTMKFSYSSMGRWFINQDGSFEWGPGDWSRDTNLYRVQPGILGTDGQIYLRGVASYLAFFRAAEPNARFYIGPDGNHNWGPGTVTQDTTLYRSGAQALKTDGALTVVGQLDIGATLNFSPASYIYNGQQPVGWATLISRAAGDADNRFTLSNTGHMYFGDGAAAPDVQLRRYVAGYLGVEGGIRLTNNLHFDAQALGGTILAAQAFGDTSLRLLLDNAGTLQWGSGGAAVDTKLYRASAGVLKTDGILNAVGGLQINGVPVGGGAVVIATTVAGLGTGTDGKLGRLRLGTTPFTYIDLIYDATLGKWVGVPWKTKMLDGNGDGEINHNTTVSTVFGTITPVCHDYSDHVAAGLRLQVRVLWAWRNESNSQGLCFVDVLSCAEGEAAWNVSASLISTGSVTLTTNQQYTSQCDLQPNDWRTLGATWDADEVIAFRFGVQSNASPGTTVTRIGEMEVIARWVSA